MKKFLCLLIAAISAFSVTSCSSYDAYESITTSVAETSQESIWEEVSVTEEADQFSQQETEAPTEIQSETQVQTEADTKTEAPIDENGSYTTKEDVSLYLYTYDHLPQNFITKKEAEALGWQGGSLEPYAPGKCIGGSRFGNYEELLPEKEGRQYYECDIDTLGADRRGAKRLVYSDDGLIYYTADHYETFELLYGEE